MKNLEIARVFMEIADLLEIKGENPFRIRAYRRAAQNLEGLTRDIAEEAGKGTLEGIPGIGKDLAKKIDEYLKSGVVEFYERLKEEIPEGLLDLLAVPGVGPRTAKLLYERLNIQGLDELEKMAREHKLKDLPGLKEKTEENILRGIQLIKSGRERMHLGLAYSLADEIISTLKSLPEVKQISPAGSLRRMKETVKDIDILIVSSRPAEVMEVFVNLPLAGEILARGETKSSIRTREGTQVDLRVVEPECFGAALAYFTGSKAHNIRLREMARKKGLKVNEYGIFKEKSGQKIAGKEEADIYQTLNLPFIPPELREDLGEIEAARKGNLPSLVSPKQIRGDLHVHSKWSDGAHSIEELARAARKIGYEYVAVTDHSQSLGIAGGLKEKDLLKQIDEIGTINRKLKGFRLLTGTEVDIRGDGSLDIADELLARLDVVVAAIHSGFKQGKEKLTKRMVRAIKNRYVNIIAHPSGRLLGEREAYELDWEEVMREARKNRTALEINAYPQRLDLNDIRCRQAKELGLSLAISTDSHTINQFGTMNLGVATARRGWLEKKDIINTLPLPQLIKKVSKPV
ncbi:MAG: DNA polymerase/3'-5' exonuclease PolX [Deltaproteobacteria bacterium]|nr:MAG: DNA polymerase/3'-5' exonuclease PolX [Deltaproteobacteria bacterium]